MRRLSAFIKKAGLEIQFILKSPFFLILIFFFPKSFCGIFHPF